MSLQISGLATLTRDAEIRATQNGAWINFGMASRRKGVPEGMQDVDFFEGTYFVKNPESKIMDYLKKGTPIYVDRAEMRADRYEKDGQKKTAFKLRIFTFDFLNIKQKDKEEGAPVAPAAEVKAPAIPVIKVDTPVAPVATPTEPKVGDITEQEVPF